MDYLRNIFGHGEDNNAINYVLEAGSLFTNSLDKFALAGKLGAEMHLGEVKEFDGGKLELLATYNNIASAVGWVKSHGHYKVNSVVRSEDFYKVNLVKDNFSVEICAYASLPGVMMNAEREILRFDGTAYDVNLASVEDVLIAGWLNENNYFALRSMADKNVLKSKYDAFPEELRLLMDLSFKLD
jgi:hypothetical protein